jgi:L-Lysine epsilon oxidase N-terminal/L-lysine epsilon oxidase C-terminal domain
MATSRKTIKKIRIHPAIGVARLGNSPEGYFIGPEIPGVHPNVSEYRDPQQFLKRQAARFRLFAYDETDELIGEITAEDPRVESVKWTVHLRNAKAAGRRFQGILHQNSPLRNLRYRRSKRYRKSALVIDGKPSCIEGINQERDIHCKSFMNREFCPPLKLGTLRTDASGRLLVLGGHGFSGTLTGSPLGKRGDDFANHDGWYDDTSDGSVRATITWKHKSRNVPVEAVPAWVIVAPPKYAPSLQSVVSLYDVLYQIALDQDLLKTGRQKRELGPRPTPSFMNDIFPVLRRAHEIGWVFARAEIGHEDEIKLTPLSRTRFEKLCQRAEHIVGQFRQPSEDPKKPGSGTGKMPYIWSDLFLMDDNEDNPHPVTATLTRHQYAVMQNWARGNFKSDRIQSRFSRKKITPEGLDRAALEACVGAALYPGIETSFHIRDKFEYVEPFRLAASKVNPGDVTQQMSLPWQTDFVDCNDGDSPFVWWPAQRPIDVRTERAPKEPPVRWARGFEGGKGDVSPEGMVRYWWRLGLLKPVASGLVETERVKRSLRAPRPPRPKPAGSRG